MRRRQKAGDGNREREAQGEEPDWKDLPILGELLAAPSCFSSPLPLSCPFSNLTPFMQIIPKTISPVLKCLWAVVKRHPLNGFIRFLSLPVIEYFHLSFHFYAPSALGGITDSFIHLGSESKICQWFFTFSFFLWLVGIQYLFYSDNISY